MGSGKPRLLVSVTVPSSAWGFMRGQLRFMREAGFEVTLVSSPGPRLDEVGAREGVKVVGVPMRREPAPFRDLVSLGRLTRLFLRLRPHIVYASTPKAGLLCGLAARAAKVPIRIYSLLGMRADGCRGLLAFVLLVAERLACRSAQRIFCDSESLRRRTLELGLAPPAKVVVPGAGSVNGVDASRFRRSPEVLARAEKLREHIGMPAGAPVVGFVGRLVRDKGVVELLQAFRMLRARIRDLRLLLVGPFEGYDAIPSEARSEISDTEHIYWTGFLDDIAPAYALMDVLAFPTYREGFGSVAIEAAAMEIPTVAAAVTGCVDAVADGVTGTLVPVRDSEALARAIGKYLDDPELRLSHGRAGRERVLREFRPERIWKALYDEYVRLLRWKSLPLPVPAPDLETPEP